MHFLDQHLWLILITIYVPSNHVILLLRSNKRNWWMSPHLRCLCRCESRCHMSQILKLGRWRWWLWHVMLRVLSGQRLNILLQSGFSIVIMIVSSFGTGLDWIKHFHNLIAHGDVAVINNFRWLRWLMFMLYFIIWLLKLFKLPRIVQGELVSRYPRFSFAIKLVVPRRHWDWYMVTAAQSTSFDAMQRIWASFNQQTWLSMVHAALKHIHQVGIIH